MQNSIKIVLAVLFFLCLLKMPYGFYELVRLAALIGFSVLAYKAHEEQRKTQMIIYVALAVMFQPLLKISFGRELWNIIDVVVGVLLLASVFIKKKER